MGGGGGTCPRLQSRGLRFTSIHPLGAGLGVGRGGGHTNRMEGVRKSSLGSKTQTGSSRSSVNRGAAVGRGGGLSDCPKMQISASLSPAC